MTTDSPAVNLASRTGELHSVRKVLVGLPPTVASKRASGPNDFNIHVEINTQGEQTSSLMTNGGRLLTHI